MLATRVIKHRSLSIPQVLIEWQGVPEQEATWEDTRQFSKDFPHFNLEDNIVFNGDGIVINNVEMDKDSHRDTGDNMDKRINRELVMPQGHMATILK